MIIKEIKMNNFKSHANSKITFDKGIVAIIGENGSGKSSIFEAVFFALFGVDSNFKYENIISKNRKSVRVELDFEVRGDNYKIIREYDNGGKAKLYKNGKLYASSISAVNKTVNEILGIDKNLFLNSIYIKQGEIAKFLMLKPSERMETIAKLLGIDEFEKCYQKMGEILKEYKSKLERLEGELSNKESFEQELRDMEKKLQEKIDELSKINETIKKIGKELKDAEDELSNIEKKKLQYEKFISKLEERKTALELNKQKLNTLKYDFNIITEAMKFLEDHKAEYEKYTSVVNRIEEIENKLKDLKESYENYVRLANKKDILEEDIKKLEEFINRSDYKGDLKYIEEEIDKIRNNIEKIEHIKDLIEELRTIYSEIEKIERYKKIKKEFEPYYKRYLELEKKYEELEKLNVEYAKLSQERSLVEENLKKLKIDVEKLSKEINSIDIKKVEESLKSIKEMKKMLEKLQKDKIELNKKIGELNSEISQLRKILIELEKVEGKCPLCKTPIDEKKKMELINQHKLKLSEKLKELDNIEHRINEINNEIEKLTKGIEKEEQLNNIKTIYLEKRKQLEKLTEKLKEQEKYLLQIEKRIENYKIDGKQVDEVLRDVKLEMAEIKQYYDNYLSAKRNLDEIDEEELKNKLNEIETQINGWNREKCKNEIDKLRDEEKKLIKIRDVLMEFNNKREELKKVENLLNEYHQNYRTYLTLNEELDQLKKIKQELKDIYEECTSKMSIIKNIKDRYPTEDVVSYLKDEISNVIKNIKDIEERIKYIRQKLEEINYREEEYEQAKIKVINKRDELEEYKKYEAEINTEIRYIKDSIKKLKEKLNELENISKEREKLSKFIDYLDKIRKIFGRHGFQSYLREKYVPLIQKYLNEAFEEFDLPYSFVELTKDFEVRVHTPEGVLNLENLSGGEQIAVALSLRLAIANALIGNRVECIILDEPTVFLDENRRAKLAEIFKKVKSIPQMIIITHHRELEEIADVIINVKKEGNVSKVSVS
ncbi:MAG: SMC family ATPase [Methanococci archaeon]|nr:SMC family ATPase [Methanococci archaeon]